VNLPPDDLVTVAEAARYLGISERQVRRLVARLPASDKQEAASGLRTAGGGVRFRLAALIELRGGSDIGPEVAGSRPEATSEREAETGSSEASEVAYLREQLSRALETIQTLSEALAESQKREHLLIASDTQRFPLPAAPEVIEETRSDIPADTTPEVAGSRPEAMSERTEADIAGVETAPEATPEPQRGFWQRLFGKGK
jgi:hypothetical protein